MPRWYPGLVAAGGVVVRVAPVARHERDGEGYDEADDAGDHEDQADGLDLEPGDVGIHRVAQDRAHGDQEDRDPYRIRAPSVLQPYTVGAAATCSKIIAHDALAEAILNNAMHSHTECRRSLLWHARTPIG